MISTDSNRLTEAPLNALETAPLICRGRPSARGREGKGGGQTRAGGSHPQYVHRADRKLGYAHVHADVRAHER